MHSFRSSAYRLAHAGLADFGMCLIVRLTSVGCVNLAESVPVVDAEADASHWRLAAAGVIEF